MTKDQSPPDLTDMARQTQALFMGTGVGGAQFEQALAMQDRLLKEAETFTRHWFERRHAATETAIEALQDAKSNGAADPGQAMRAMAEWQRGSLARLSADMQDWTALCMRCAGAAMTTQTEMASPDAESEGSGKSPGKAASGGAGKTAGKADAKADGKEPSKSTGHATPV